MIHFHLDDLVQDDACTLPDSCNRCTDELCWLIENIFFLLELSNTRINMDGTCDRQHKNRTGRERVAG